MDLYLLSSLMLILGGLALWLKKTYLQPVTLFAYGLSLMIVAFVESSNIQFIFAVRYFVYVISGFVIAFMPIIFILIFILILLKGRKASKEQLSDTIINSLIAIFLLAVTVIIMWGMFSFEQEAWEGLVSALVNMTIYFIAIIFIFIILNAYLHLLPTKSPVQLIAILGARVEDSEQIPLVLTRRVRYAIKVYSKLTSDEQKNVRFIVSGSQSVSGAISEALAMERLLIAGGIPQSQIILEEQATTTEENLYFVKRVVESNQWLGDLLVITSDFHLVRTQLLAWNQVVSVNLKGASTPFWLVPYYLVRDLLGFIVLTKGINVMLLIYLLVRGFIIQI
ncbi:YdcF family protein [Aerococcaceae bacterium DSM 111022]|nr:YdcF family protein [Aerococcaceae bacterium DSM 111022]